MDLTKGEAPSTEAKPERFHIVGKVKEVKYVFRWWQAALVAVGFLALEGAAIGLAVAVAGEFAILAAVGGSLYLIGALWLSVLIQEISRDRVLPRWALTVEDTFQAKAQPGCRYCVPSLHRSDTDYVCRLHKRQKVERVLYYGGEKRARKVADKLLASVKAEAVKEAVKKAKRQAALTGYFRIPPD